MQVLTKLRIVVDQIDIELQKLLTKRAEVALQIAAAKKKSDKPIF